ncbi:hypothetical protein BKA62DRAFT_674768 [Auriculariales sp. MPI-PUGE-AT-0066]|nr:hypothetical protein BKA62DRAFT_674768 [Auriculariales sp. MPI-PUGE-AT-0066]
MYSAPPLAVRIAATEDSSLLDTALMIVPELVDQVRILDALVPFCLQPHSEPIRETVAQILATCTSLRDLNIACASAHNVLEHVISIMRRSRAKRPLTMLRKLQLSGFPQHPAIDGRVLSGILQLAPELREFSFSQVRHGYMANLNPAAFGPKLRALDTSVDLTEQLLTGDGGILPRHLFIGDVAPIGGPREEYFSQVYRLLVLTPAVKLHNIRSVTLIQIRFAPTTFGTAISTLVRLRHLVLRGVKDLQPFVALALEQILLNVAPGLKTLELNASALREESAVDPLLAISSVVSRVFEAGRLRTLRVLMIKTLEESVDPQSSLTLVNLCSRRRINVVIRAA